MAYTLTAKVVGDASSFKNTMKESEKTLSDLGSKFSSFGTKASLAITAPLLLAKKKLIESASDYEENLNKVESVFGESANSIKSWANNARKQFGLSKNSALEMTSLFGDMATSMGLTQNKSADMAKSLAGLAGDLASFKNIKLEEAMTALNGVFTGETESLKRLGVVMTETNLEEFAKKTGKVYKNMTQAEKVQLRYNYVMSQTKNAHGDFAKTSDGTANSIRSFKEATNDAAVVFGQKLLPTFTPFIQKATELMDRFANLSPQTQGVIVKVGLLAAAMGPAAKAIGGTMKAADNFGKVIEKIKSEETRKKLQSLKNAFESTGKGIANSMNTMKSVVQTSVSAVGTAFDNMKNKLPTAGNAIKTAMINIGGSIKTGASTALQGAKAMAIGVGSSFKSMAISIYSTLAPFLPIIAAVAVLTAAFVYLFKTNDEFRNSMLQSWEEIKAAFVPLVDAFSNLISGVVQAIAPAISELGAAFAEILSTAGPFISQIVRVIASIAKTIIAVVLPVVKTVIGVFAKVFGKVAQAVGEFVKGPGVGLFEIFGTIAGVIGTLVSTLVTKLAPVLSTIATVMSTVVSSIVNIVTTIISALMPVITTIISIISTYVIPVITGIITTVMNVITKIIAIITPIITFIANIIGAIISVIARIISAVALIFGNIKNVIMSIFNGIASFIGTVIGVIKTVIAAIVTPVRIVFNAIRSIVVGVFNAVKGAWTGLKGFVGGVFDGVLGAFKKVIDFFKATVNAVIKGINMAIKVINYIPGVEISPIKQLARGTENWQGGFARINEGGRGELTYLPGGTVVVPHDISMKYARESARANATGTNGIDVQALGDYIISAISNQGRDIAAGLQKGIGSIRMVADGRETARFIENLGFSRG